MEKFIDAYYLEPEKICPKEIEDEEDLETVYVPEGEETIENDDHIVADNDGEQPIENGEENVSGTDFIVEDTQVPEVVIID